jgi:hypothetical protein
MSKKTVNVGLIGYQFMGKAHSNAYRQVNHFFPELPVEVHMHTLCGRNEAKVREAAHQYGWKHIETDWRKVVENPEIDVIDISTPGNLHAEIAIAAAKAGKAVFCEKPIGNTLPEAKAMLEAVMEAVTEAILEAIRLRAIVRRKSLMRPLRCRQHGLRLWPNARPNGCGAPRLRRSKSRRHPIRPLS